MQHTETQPANEPKQNLTITRIIQAPRAEVWKAFTEPDIVREWWGPRDFTTPDVHIDLREGGRYLNAMQSPDGQKIWSTGRYLAVDPPRRLEMTDSFSNEDGEVINAEEYGMGSGFPLETIVTYDFEEDGDRTRLTLHYDDVSGIPEEHLEGMKQGWNEMFDKLDEFFQRQSAPSCPI